MCTTHANGNGLMRGVGVDEDGDHHAFNPCGANKEFDLAFPRVEVLLVAFLGKNGETFEVTEAIIKDADDLAGESPAVLVGDLRRRDAVGVGKDGSGVAAESVDAADEIRDVANENGIPAVGGKHLGEPPLHDGEGVFLERKHDF